MSWRLHFPWAFPGQNTEGNLDGVARCSQQTLAATSMVKPEKKKKNDFWAARSWFQWLKLISLDKNHENQTNRNGSNSKPCCARIPTLELIWWFFVGGLAPGKPGKAIFLWLNLQFQGQKSPFFAEFPLGTWPSPWLLCALVICRRNFSSPLGLFS